MKDGGFRKASQPISSHLIKPVLNGLSDLLRLPQYPVLGVRAAASTGVRREGELYTHAHAEGKRGAAPAQDGHKLRNDNRLRHLSRPHGGDAGAPGRPPRPGKPAPAPRKLAHNVSDSHIYVALAARNRNAGYADRPSPLPARRRPEQPGSSAFGPGTGPPAKNASSPLPIARKRAALNAGITYVGANSSAPRCLYSCAGSATRSFLYINTCGASSVVSPVGGMG